VTRGWVGLWRKLAKPTAPPWIALFCCLAGRSGLPWNRGRWTPCADGCRCPRSSGRKCVPDPAEVATLADAIHRRYRALVLVGSYGGLRIGELAGLRRSRVDLLRGTVQVAEILVEVQGVLHFGPPKTRASRRSVGLPRFVVEALAAHLAEPGDPEGFVFTAPQGDRVPGWVWRPATKAAGLDGLRIHDLRQTAVALWIAAGANPKEVAARAGHASVSFTLAGYGHLYPEADSALRDRLDVTERDRRSGPDQHGTLRRAGIAGLGS